MVLMNGDRLVTAEGLGLWRAGRWLIRDVSLRVDRGEIVSLIGPNGGGKSTTARMVAGILKPDAGRLDRAAGLRIGYVPQRLAVDAALPMTVSGLMTLTGPQTRQAVAAALEEVGIARLAHAQVHTLSGGEFQRALLARAILRDPDLLILDEPVQGVDVSGEAALYGLIAAIRDKRRCGILLVSHDLHVVMAQTDRVICLNGHVCCSGAPASVAANPEYVRLFGARAAGALAGYVHHHDHDHDHAHGHAAAPAPATAHPL